MSISCPTNYKARVVRGLSNVPMITYHLLINVAFVYVAQYLVLLFLHISNLLHVRGRLLQAPLALL